MAENWWLSSRNNTSNSRNVNTDGTANNNNPSNSNGVVPDLDGEPEQVALNGERRAPSFKGGRFWPARANTFKPCPPPTPISGTGREQHGHIRQDMHN